MLANDRPPASFLFQVSLAQLGRHLGETFCLPLLGGAVLAPEFLPVLWQRAFPCMMGHLPAVLTAP